MKCGLKGCVGMSVERKRGGLAMLWKEEINMNLLSFSAHHIDMEIEGGLQGNK